MNEIAQVTLTVACGEFRTFGHYGPTYQILAIDTTRRTAHIEVLGTGEQLDYPLDHIVRDPEAA